MQLSQSCSYALCPARGDSSAAPQQVHRPEASHAACCSAAASCSASPHCWQIYTGRSVAVPHCSSVGTPHIQHFPVMMLFSYRTTVAVNKTTVWQQNGNSSSVKGNLGKLPSLRGVFPVSCVSWAARGGLAELVRIICHLKAHADRKSLRGKG